jgi:hypothetical protein
VHCTFAHNEAFTEGMFALKQWFVHTAASTNPYGHGLQNCNHFLVSHIAHGRLPACCLPLAQLMPYKPPTCCFFVCLCACCRGWGGCLLSSSSSSSRSNVAAASHDDVVSMSSLAAALCKTAQFLVNCCCLRPWVASRSSSLPKQQYQQREAEAGEAT